MRSPGTGHPGKLSTAPAGASYQTCSPLQQYFGQLYEFVIESFGSFRPAFGERVNAQRLRRFNGGVVSPAVKYSNWLVTMILLLMGARLLFAAFPGLLGSNEFWVPLAQAIHAILFIIAAVGIFRWRDWGRLLAITICAWNLFAALFLITPGTIQRGARLSFCALFVLLIFWLQLPKIKLQFVRPG